MSYRIGAAATVGLAVLSAAPAALASKPNEDAFYSSGARKQLNAAVRGAAKPGTQVQTEARLGVPTILWAAEPHGKADVRSHQRGASPDESAARGHLKRLAGVYGLTADDVDSVKTDSILDTGRGPVVVTLRQRVGGIPVYREAASVLMTQDLDLVGISGYLSPSDGPAPTFALDSKHAVAAALADLLETGFDADALAPQRPEGGYDEFALTNAASRDRDLRFRDSARAKRVMYHLPNGLEPAYYVEVTVTAGDTGNPRDYAYVIAAGDGRVLSRTNLTEDAAPPKGTGGTPYSYRVWADTQGPNLPLDGPQGDVGSPHPTGMPDGFEPLLAAPSLVTLAFGPIATHDPWLAPNATETSGNNVEAYADLVAPDGFTPASADMHATLTSPGAFDHTYDTSLVPRAAPSQSQAVITQLFYDVNFFHDWYYDAGFDEVAGNAQTDNYGRGGFGGDSIRAEAQDFGGRDNASMSTPADGQRPQMQTYLFNGGRTSSLTLSSPASVAGYFSTGSADFGARNADLTRDLELIQDGVGSQTDGCESPFANDVAGKIAVIDRGTCEFAVKVKNAQNNGAAAVLVVNNVPDATVEMGGSDPSITIPALSVSGNDGARIKTTVQGEPVTGRLRLATHVDRDGGIDNQVVAHEWAHYMSSRLVGGGGALGPRISRGLGEGWSDFNALVMTVRAEDASSSFNGAYPLGAYSTTGLFHNSFYFGFRRVPYSTDFAKNALTFRHIAEGAHLPDVPTSFGQDGAENAEVHSTGEVWATMLWECYAALLRDTTGPDPRLSFGKAQRRMRDYFVASLKMTPPNPTLLEARDALLMAAFARDKRDVVAFWQAFARRGAGVGAVAPDRGSQTNSPVTESFDAGESLAFVSATLTDDKRSCDRGDGYVDNGETGRLVVTLRNIGGTRLNDSTATITSNNPSVQVKDSTITFKKTDPFETTTASAEVGLEGATGVQQPVFTIAFTDGAIDPPGPFIARYTTYAGADVARSGAAADDVESHVSAWTTRTDAGGPTWARETISMDPINSVWHGPDPGGIADLSLVSPPLAVGTSPFSFSFRHRYSFEPGFDGGTVELSTDGGATWADIGQGYTGTIPTGSDNPLANRSAYMNASLDYPGFTTQTIDLGTAYAGRTVLIRFRSGADAYMAGAGWDVDDLAFTGLTNTPFHALVADPGCGR